MAFNQAAMQAFADYTVANANGRTKDLAGRDLNVDGRYGYQCMDLWIWARYRLGFTDNLPTPDAAAVWEMNWTEPQSRMWEFFDAVTPDKRAQAGDFFVMNRDFFGNGVGHIGMVLADLGGSIRVLELNGLNDGFEDARGQHGSPARIQDWPKTHLYGYLRWIGTAPTLSSQSGTTTPITEEGFLMALSDQDQIEVRDNLRKLVGAAAEDKKFSAGVNEKVDELVGNVRKVFWNTAEAKILLASAPPADLAAQIDAAGLAAEVRDELVKLLGGSK